MLGLTCSPAGILLRHDLPEPVPAPHEILLNVRLAGICDTDLQLARGYMGFHGILGHEFIATDPAGQRVTSEINFPCQNCLYCQTGMGNHCPHRSVLGILNQDGAMAARVCVPRHALHPIPDELDDLDAIFIEPLAAAFRMVEQVQPQPGQRLAILGDGKLGILCAWAARLSPAEVHLIGKHLDKLALVGAGIQTHLLGQTAALAHAFDIVVDATGSPTGLPSALGLVRPCGTVVLKTTIAGSHDASLAPIVIDEIRVIGSRCGPFPRAIAALAAREVNVRPLIGAIFPLQEAERAFSAAAQPGARKVLLRVDDSAT